MDVNRLPNVRDSRIITTGGHYGYLKIAEGCDKHCTYCVIPYVRGRYRSVPMADLIKEARDLAGAGVKELILVAQETTVYGVDLYGEKTLPKLLHELCQVGGIQWIRILYCYPEEITDELIETIASQPKLLHYLDIPIQHCNDGILKAMRRRNTRAELEALFVRLRSAMPDVVIRTSLICGLPGEGEAEFEELCQFLREQKLQRAGVFQFSPEEGTLAAAMETRWTRRLPSAGWSWW